MIIWLASYPRSGNGFLRTVLHHGFGVTSGSIYSSDRNPLAQQVGNGNAFARMNYFCQNLDADGDLHFTKTHDLPFEDSYPTIYLVRDGRDSLVSHSWFHLEVHKRIKRENITRRQFYSVLKQLVIRGNPRFGSWSDNVDAWASRRHSTILRFEQLIEKRICGGSNNSIFRS